MTTLAHRATTDLGTFVQVREAHSYTRAPPSFYNLTCDEPDLLQWFQRTLSDTANCPAQGYIRVKDIFLFHGRHALTRDLEWIEETMHGFGNGHLALPTIRGVVARNAYVIRETDPGRPTLILCKGGSGNYGHFLIDIAPKLINVACAGFRRVRILMPPDAVPFAGIVRDICGRLDVDAEIVGVQHHEIAVLEEAIVFTPVSTHNQPKSQALAELRDLALAMHGSPEKPFRKVYIDRPAGSKRRATNGEEIAALFATREFEVVDPAAMAWQTQVRLFSECTHIAGQLGAGLTNALFAPRDTQVYMLDNGLGDPWFWDLSSLIGQRFHWFFGAPFQRWRLELSLEDYAIDAENVRAWLQLCDL